MDDAIEIVSLGEEQTLAMGVALGECLVPGSVVGLVGDLGAGKTCFARGAARGLHVDPRVYVSSPTFTLVNEYRGRIPLYHIDLYRLSEADELDELGIDEYTHGPGACLVEWFDRFPEEMPREHLLLTLSVTGDEARRITAHPRGALHRDLCGRWLGRLGLDGGSSCKSPRVW